MGLKDQSLALKWIHENIEFFGGDQNKITLLGLSAGAASVHYHYLSPKSAGLFQNGISFSGTALNVWSMTQGSARDKAFKLGRIMNCSTTNTQHLIHCLKACSADDITLALDQFMTWGSMSPVEFGPIVEKSTSDWLINESPITIINSGKAYNVSWITGVVSEEGLLFLYDHIDNKSLPKINDDWNNISPVLLDYTTEPKEKQAHLSKTIREHYFDTKSISNETKSISNFNTLVHLVGDRRFVVDAEKIARAQAKAGKSSVWFYKYSYKATDNRISKFTNKTGNFGVMHGEDISLVIKNDYVIPTKSPNDMLMQGKLIQLLTSFAYNRIPELGVDWPSVDPSNPALQYLHMRGPEKIATEINYNLGEKKFWNSVNFSEDNI